MNRSSILGAVAFAAAVSLISSSWLQVRAQDPEPAGDLAPEAWCGEHDVPEGECTACHPGLVERFKAANDWCGGHGLPESHCEPCNPGTLAARRAAAAKAAPTEAWCREHDVPEGECTACHPEQVERFKAANDWCGGHGLPESHCEPCNPGTLAARRAAALGGAAWGEAAPETDPGAPRHRRPPSPTCQTQFLRVRLATDDTAARAGLQVAKVVEQRVSPTLSCNAVVSYDLNRLTRLAPRTAGVVRAIHCDLGDVVEVGQALLEVEAMALGAAKASLLQAQALVDLWTKNHAREVRLLEQEIVTAREVLEAETRLVECQVALAKARQDLLNLGLTSDEVEAVLRSRDTSGLLVVRAPFAGTVIAREAALGEVVGPARQILTVVDLSTRWALLDVPERGAARVRPGLRVELESDGVPGAVFVGRVTWVSPGVDPRTRTVKARAELPDPEGRLRAHAFGRARIAFDDPGPKRLVPQEAVQWEGCCNVVFVRLSDTLYEPRKVALGAAHGDAFEVLRGLEPGEEVVTVGSFLLKTEVLKENIGAGCCEPASGE